MSRRPWPLRSRIHIAPQNDRFRSECQECGWHSTWVSRRPKAERHLRDHQAAVHDAGGAEEPGDAEDAGVELPADPDRGD